MANLPAPDSVVTAADAKRLSISETDRGLIEIHGRPTREEGAALAGLGEIHAPPAGRRFLIEDDSGEYLRATIRPTRDAIAAMGVRRC